MDFTADICLVALSYLVAVFDPARRQRVELFARMHNLPITVANARPVMNYLGTTRRWRAAGMAIAIGGAIAAPAFYPAARQHGSQTDALWVVLGGWFAGALVAELRVARVSFGERRAASLQPREPVIYLSRLIWWLLPSAALLIGATTVASLIALAAGRHLPVATIAWPGGAGVLVWLTVETVRRHVLRRPQPVASHDLIAADDAIRSRSLHVLTGGGFVLVGDCALLQLSPLLRDLLGVEHAARYLLPATVLIPIIGRLAAARRWTAVRPERAARPIPVPTAVA